MAQVPYKAFPDNDPAAVQQPFLRGDMYTADAMGAGIGKGIDMLGQAFAYLAQDHNREQDFNRTSDMVKLESHLAQRLAERTRAAQGTDGANFTKDWDQEIRETLAPHQRGLSGSHGAGWNARYTSLRERLFLQGFQTELTLRDTSRGTKLAEGFQTLIKDLQKNPVERERYVRQGDALIDQAYPDMSAEFRAQKKKEFADAANYAYGLSIEPARVVNALTGNVANRASRGMEFFQSKGLTRDQAAGLVGNLVGESGLNPTARNPGDGRDGSDSIGSGQWNAERAQSLRRFAAARGKDWTDYDTQLEFIWYELTTGEGGNAGVLDKLRRARTVDEATAVIANDYERPKGSGRGNPALISGWSARLSAAQRLAGGTGERAATPGDPGMMTPGSTVQTGTRAPLSPSYQQDQVLNSLPIKQQSELLAYANQAIKKQEEEIFKTVKAQYDNYLNELLVGIRTGDTTLAKINNAIDSGSIPKFDDQQKLLNAWKKHEEDGNYARAGYGLIATGKPLDPHNEEYRKAFSAVHKKESPDFATQSKIGQDIYNNNKIVTKEYAGVLRQGIASRDPKVMQEALLHGMRIMNNSFDRGFDGTPDSSQLKKDVEAFRARIESFGETPRQATQYVAQLNSDEFQQKNKFIGERQAQELRDEWRKPGHINELLGLFSAEEMTGPALNPAARGFFGQKFYPVADGNTQTRMLADYSNLIVEGMQNYNNLDMAKATAQAKIKSMYGVVGTTLMKFPPTKTVPADSNGSRQWVLQQAASEVNNTLQLPPGEEVMPWEVVPMAVPGEGAIAWNSGGRVPYYLWYKRTIGGVEVWDWVYGPDSATPRKWSPALPETQTPPNQATLDQMNKPPPRIFEDSPNALFEGAPSVPRTILRGLETPLPPWAKPDAPREAPPPSDITEIIRAPASTVLRPIIQGVPVPLPPWVKQGPRNPTVTPSKGPPKKGQ